jgi:hypothetical protein
MVTSELRRVRYPFAGRAAAPRVDPTLRVHPGTWPGFFVRGSGGAACRTYDLSGESSLSSYSI